MISNFRCLAENSARRLAWRSWGRAPPPRRWRRPPSSSSSRARTCSTWCSTSTRRRRSCSWRCLRPKVTQRRWTVSCQSQFSETLAGFRTEFLGILKQLYELGLSELKQREAERRDIEVRAFFIRTETDHCLALESLTRSLTDGRIHTLETKSMWFWQIKIICLLKSDWCCCWH